MSEQLLSRIWGVAQATVARGTVSAVARGRRMLLRLQLLSGETRSNIEMMQPWGYSSFPTGGDVVALRVGGSPDHMVVVVVDDIRTRIRDLVPGEVGLSDGEQRIVVRAARLELATPRDILLHADGSVTLLGSTVIAGSLGGTVRRLVDERFMTLFNGHTHADPQGGTTGVPDQPMTAGQMTATFQAD